MGFLIMETTLKRIRKMLFTWRKIRVFIRDLFHSEKKIDFFTGLREVREQSVTWLRAYVSGWAFGQEIFVHLLHFLYNEEWMKAFGPNHIKILVFCFPNFYCTDREWFNLISLHMNNQSCFYCVNRHDPNPTNWLNC